jgi:tartrate dehydrogenase/decarboxylase/D-malate dehydrogenase
LHEHRIAAGVAREVPDVSWDKMLVDAMKVRMTPKPQSLDTIVAPNLRTPNGAVQ